MTNHLKKILIAGSVPVAIAIQACANSDSTGSDIAGSTNEPNAKPVAELTPEQQKTLKESFSQIADEANSSTSTSTTSTSTAKSSASSTPDCIDCGIIREESEEIKVELKILFPFSGAPDKETRYVSKDDRRSCDVATYPTVPGVRSKREMTLGPDYSHLTHTRSITAARAVVSGGDTIIIKTVGNEGYLDGFWGMDYSCTDYLAKFKEECNNDNGVFMDFGDSCQTQRLMIGCAMFLPENVSAKEFIDNYAGELDDFCKQDSVWYSPNDKEENAPKSCYGVGDENGFTTNCPG